MFSTTELLTAHHDAKLLKDARKRLVDGPPAERRRHLPDPFRAGLSVKIGDGHGHERRARIIWTEGDAITEAV